MPTYACKFFNHWGKIPGAWLLQIKDAGHAVISHQLNIINKMLQKFLSTTTINLTAHSLTEYARSDDYSMFIQYET
jgi:hypothetical protein